MLILTLGRVDAAQIASEISEKTPVKWIGGYMLFTGIGLVIAWTAQWLTFMLSGAVPDAAAEGFKLIASSDLHIGAYWVHIGDVPVFAHTTPIAILL